jgi:hypothetical protein
LSWLSPRFPVDRLSDKLVNDKINKYSAYYWWSNLSLLHNKPVLKILTFFFGKKREVSPIVDNHKIFWEEP